MNQQKQDNEWRRIGEQKQNSAQGSDNKKRHRNVYLTLTLLGFLMLSVWGLVPSVASEARMIFYDVPDTYWASSVISRCTELGLLEPVESKRFGIGTTVSRGEFIMALDRLFNWPKVKTSSEWEYKSEKDTVFADVPLKLSCAQAVERAFAQGVLTRQTDYFHPEAPVTREDMAVMLVRAMGYDILSGLAQDLDSPFEDVNRNIGYIHIAYDLGLVDGYSSQQFRPSEAAKREQIAAVLIRAYDRIAPKLDTIGIATSAKDLPDLNGFDAVAEATGKLIFLNDAARFVYTMEESELFQFRKAVQSSGTRELLYVSATENAITRGDPVISAQIMAEELQNNAYGGVFLDVPNLRTYAAQKALNLLAITLQSELSNKDLPIYIVIEAPLWGSASQYIGYDWEVLGQAADYLVVRLPDYVEQGVSFPTNPPEPTEQIYYALSKLSDGVEMQKIFFMLSTNSTLWANQQKTNTLNAEGLAQLQKSMDTRQYYSNRYDSAYLICNRNNQEVVTWYLNDKSVQARKQLLAAFGTSGICLKDINAASSDLLPPA